MSEQKINKAIHECLEFCYQSSDVVTGIAAFLSKLRTSGEWSNPEILQIDSGVRHLLHGIVDEQSDSSAAQANDL